VVEEEQEVAVDIKIKGIIMQMFNVIIVRSMIISLQIVHNINLKIKVLTLPRRDLILKTCFAVGLWKI
jgi:hypothetical protein